MLRLWGWCIDNAPDGNLTGIYANELAIAAGWEGDEAAFLQAVTDSGFIDKDEDTLCIHDWNDYAGRLIEQREIHKEQARERQKRFRQNHAKCNAKITRDKRVNNALTVPNSTVPNIPPTPKGDARSSYDSRFQSFWSAYPKKIGKGDAEKAFLRCKPDDTLLAVMLSAVERQRQCEQWRKDGGQYVPNPATWLRQKRWEDEPVQEPKPADPWGGIQQL